MKKYLLLLLPGFFAAHATAQNLQWAKRLGGSGVDQAYATALDASGNIYTTGWFSDTVDFDPGPGVFNLTSAGVFDIFICKLDAAGNFLWAKRIGGSGTDEARSIVVDASGNVYISGQFMQSVDFDPGPGVYPLPSLSSFFSFFTLKLDTNGNFIWAHTVGSSTAYSFSTASANTIDGSGDVYTTGVYQGTADFDPGSGRFILTATGFSSAFILKQDSAGNVLWVKSLASTMNSETYAITTDPAGNIVATGRYSGTTDFDPGEGVFELSVLEGTNPFIVKLDASGDFVWARNIEGNYNDKAGFGVTTDATGNIYTIGTFGGTADFDPGPGANLVTARGEKDVFILKLDPTGNFIWVKSIGSPNTTLGNSGSSIRLDPAGNIYTTGYFYGTADFDPGARSFELSSAGGLETPDIYVLKLDPAGNFAYALRIGSTLFDLGTSVTPDAAGNVYVSGYFNDTADFDPGNGVYNLVSAGTQDGFILKLGPSPLPLSLLEFKAHLFDGNGLLNWKTTDENNLAGFEVERSIDGSNYGKTGFIAAANNGGTHNYSFNDPDVNSLGANVIYYRLRQMDIDGGFVFSRVIALTLAEKNRVLFYPNPVKTSAGITVTVNKALQLKASITDNNGRVVLKHQWRLSVGSTFLSIDLTPLPTGIYNLSLSGTTIHFTKQFEKQ